MIVYGLQINKRKMKTPKKFTPSLNDTIYSVGEHGKIAHIP